MRLIKSISYLAILCLVFSNPTASAGKLDVHHWETAESHYMQAKLGNNDALRTLQHAESWNHAARGFFAFALFKGKCGLIADKAAGGLIMHAVADALQEEAAGNVYLFTSNKRALFLLGMMHIEGIGCSPSPPMGAAYLNEAVTLGYAPAQMYYARYLESLGKMYYAEARILYQMAAQADFTAQHTLAHKIRTGKCGFTVNRVEAFRLNKLAADRGYPIAQCNLGCLYKHGEGTAPDEAQALAYYLSAGEKGILNGYFYHGLITHKRREYSAAHASFLAAANRGHGESLYHLGIMYHEGRGIPRDLSTAENYLMQAATMHVNGALARLLSVRQALAGLPTPAEYGGVIMTGPLAGIGRTVTRST